MGSEMCIRDSWSCVRERGCVHAAVLILRLSLTWGMVNPTRMVGQGGEDARRDRHDPGPDGYDGGTMCRNIKTLFNFDPPATDEEVRAASLQFVRKLSGFTKPSQANQQVFDTAVDEVADVARRLIDRLVTTAPSRDRAEVAARARARAAERFGRAAAP